MGTGEVPIKRLEPIDIAAYAKQHDKLAQLGARVLEILRATPWLPTAIDTLSEHDAASLARGFHAIARSLGLLGEGEAKP
jgi:hypothetical protein